MQVTCPAFPETGPSGELVCVDGVGSPVAWEPLPPIDWSAVGAPFSAGFVLVAACWALGHGVAVFVDLVRR
jgi:hypothetical protein